MSRVATALLVAWFGTSVSVSGCKERETRSTKPADSIPTPPKASAEEAVSALGEQIVVMHRESLKRPQFITRDKASARVRAAQAKTKADTGTDFAILVREYSDDPNAESNAGALEPYLASRDAPELARALESTRVGEVSKVIETDYGFHVIKRTQ